MKSGKNDREQGWLMLNIGKEEEAPQGKGRRQKKLINEEEVREQNMWMGLKRKKKRLERKISQSIEPKT